ncbi:MAG: ECF transporter S component [Anaerolineae bacterium]
MKMHRLLQWAVYGLVNLVGGLTLFFPFLAPQVEARQDTALFTALLLLLCVAALLLEIQGEVVGGARFVALLGVLVAINAVLRFAETALPGPGGFSPVFFLITLAGYVYGGRFGFLMGSLTLLVSALITGGIGPWLPYQMLITGWVGLSTELLRRLPLSGRTEILLLTLFVALWGLLYGALSNLWFWPFAVGLGDQAWRAGLTFTQTLRRYALFYAATSLAWDVARAGGNVALMLLFGRATLRTLRRFHRRFTFIYDPT